MSDFFKRLYSSGWEGVGYLALLIVLPGFVGVPLVLWLLKQQQTNS